MRNLVKRYFLMAALLFVATSCGGGSEPTRTAAQSDDRATRETAAKETAAAYDVAIIGGRVIDPETGLDAVRNVGLTDDKIAAITEQSITGAKVIDASGHIVSPGFIDLHAHGQSIPGGRMQALDGVTTALELEAGVMPVDKFYDTAAQEGRAIHYGASVNWLSSRYAKAPGEGITPEQFAKAFGQNPWAPDIADPDRMKRILANIAHGLDNGGIGVGVLIGYAPSVSRAEYYAISALAGDRGAPTFSHVRFNSVIEPRSSFESIQELIAVAASTGAHMHICHLNSTAMTDIGRITELIVGAQKTGAPVTVEAYPYGRGSTSIGSALFRGEDWRDRYGGIDASDFFLNGKALTEEEFSKLQSDAPGTTVVIRMLDIDKPAERAALDKAVFFPGGVIASDGMPWTVDGEPAPADVWPMPENAYSHPRSSGTFARFLGRFVRENDEISWSEGIHRVSTGPAQIIEDCVPQMKAKGRLQEGADADIVVFNPDTIIDRATFVEPAQPSDGIAHVIVAGVHLIEDGALDTSVLPGQAIRGPVKKRAE